MNHLTAAQKGEGGGWHYVSLNRRTGGHPIGYCRTHEPHDTEAEARNCYGLYRRANVKLDGKLTSWSDCRECGDPTKQFAHYGDGYSLVPLCAKHLTHDLAVTHLHLEGPAGDAWES